MTYRYVGAIPHGVLGILVGGKVCFILPPVICCCYLDKKKFPSPSNIREFIVFSNVYNNRSNLTSSSTKIIFLYRLNNVCGMKEAYSGTQQRAMGGCINRVR